MNLHGLLTDRPAINILKRLYEQEVSKKNSYTMKLSEICSELGFRLDVDKSVTNLTENGLIGLDTVDNDKIMSITRKGKEFIEIFDQLVELASGDKTKTRQKGVRVEYVLTMLEKRILVMAAKISKEIGMDFISVRTLTREIYPYDAYERKSSTVSRYISKLEELRLVEKKREGRENYVRVTQTGLRTIKEQFLEGILHAR